MAYTKTNWVDGETPITANNLNKIENQLENNTNDIEDLIAYIDNKCKNEVATIQLTSEVSLTEGYIPFNIIYSTSDKLTLSNNGIKIGSGVSKIKVSANAFGASTSNTSYLWTQIEKIRAGQKSPISIAIDNTNTFFGSTAHTPILLNTQENDIIKLYKLDNNNITIRGGTNTYLTVEIVE